MRILRKIAPLAAIVVLASSCGGGRVIPARDLTDIYAEMFLADQWVSSRPAERRVADTTLFYEPIFRDHGYTTADYQVSVSYYVSHPDKYTRILRDAGRKLDAEKKRLQRVGRILAARYHPLAYEREEFPERLDSLIWKPDTASAAVPAPADTILVEADTAALPVPLERMIPISL